jgi:hypothetical protein
MLNYPAQRRVQYPAACCGIVSKACFGVDTRDLSGNQPQLYKDINFYLIKKFFQHNI